MNIVTPNVGKHVTLKDYMLRKLVRHQTVITTPHYWDCECSSNYIHPKSQIKCDICGATSESQPDSRTNEVIMYGHDLNLMDIFKETQ